MLHYLNNPYIISTLTTILGLAIVFVYDKFEKKQYNSAIYFRFAILIYISSYLSLYLSTYINGKINITHSEAIISNVNDIVKTGLEQFKTGIPTF